jgi:hypothetical protein
MTHSRPSRSRRSLALAGALGALLAVPSPRGAAADDPIFVLADPEKDDHGDGHLRYPVRSRNDMLPGHLDLVSFAAYPAKDGTTFEATFARPIVRTERAPLDDGGTMVTDVMKLGFYTFNVDVYVDKDGVRGSGNTLTLPGRNAEVDPAHAWEKAVCLTPLPGPAGTLLQRNLARQVRRETLEGRTEGGRVAESEKAGIRAEVTRLLADSVFFPTRVEVRGRKVRFFVPDSFLGGRANAGWGYVVAVSGADAAGRFDVGRLIGAKEDSGPEPLFIMRAAPGRSENTFGGGDEDAPSPCPLVDIVVPPGTTQEKVLADYDTPKRRPIRLPAVVPVPVAPAK